MEKPEQSGPARERYDAITERLVREQMGVVATKLFGMPTLKVDDNTFAGFSGAEMVFKLAGDDHARALGLAGARLSDPSGRGRPMKAWVQVPFAHASEWDALAERALALASGAA